MQIFVLQLFQVQGQVRKKFAIKFAKLNYFLKNSCCNYIKSKITVVTIDLSFNLFVKNKSEIIIIFSEIHKNRKPLRPPHPSKLAWPFVGNKEIFHILPVFKWQSSCMITYYHYITSLHNTKAPLSHSKSFFFTALTTRHAAPGNDLEKTVFKLIFVYGH